MKKSEPKMILNVAIENSELEEKVKIAMDKYMEQLVCKDIDAMVMKYVDKRISELLNGRSWSSYSKIDGVSFSEFVKQRTEKALIEAIDKNAKDILVKKLAQLI